MNMNMYETGNLQAKIEVDTADKNSHNINAAIALLNDLIDINRGIINVYETAVARLENETNKDLLQGYAAEHETFVSELSNVVVSLSGQPTTSSSGGNLLKQAWITLKATVTAGDGPILAEVAQDAENVLEAYGEAMGQDLPDDARNVIRQHLSKARLNQEQLSALHAAFSS